MTVDAFCPECHEYVPVVVEQKDKDYGVKMIEMDCPACSERFEVTLR